MVKVAEVESILMMSLRKSGLVSRRYPFQVFRETYARPAKAVKRNIRGNPVFPRLQPYSVLRFCFFKHSQCIQICNYNTWHIAIPPADSPTMP